MFLNDNLSISYSLLSLPYSLTRSWLIADTQSILNEWMNEWHRFAPLPSQQGQYCQDSAHPICGDSRETASSWTEDRNLAWHLKQDRQICILICPWTWSLPESAAPLPAPSVPLWVAAPWFSLETHFSPSFSTHILAGLTAAPTHVTLAKGASFGTLVGTVREEEWLTYSLPNWEDVCLEVLRDTLATTR